ncbi:hypothetical protein TNCV_1947981, partial [Trichonephila clavipes]
MLFVPNSHHVNVDEASRSASGTIHPAQMMSLNIGFAQKAKIA